MTENLLRPLNEYLASAYPDRVQPAARDLVSLNNGWESDVYAFSVEWGPPTRRETEALILRVYPGDDAYIKSEKEYRALSMLHSAGYPVPRVDHLEREHSPFGKPFLIMERIAGQGMWQRMFHGPEAEQPKLLMLFCGLLVQLHTIDWRPLVPDPQAYEPGGPKGVVQHQFNRWEQIMGNLPLPGFQANWEWLRARQHSVASVGAVFTHWDFHPENILLCADGSAVVIDWTNLDISDYRFDLAWTLLLIGSHEALKWRDPLIREYERQAGHAVENLEFFDAAAALRRLYSVVVSATFGAEKLGMRPGAEQIMRSQAPATRRVYQLLLERTGLPVPEVETFLAEAGA